MCLNGESNHRGHRGKQERQAKRLYRTLKRAHEPIHSCGSQGARASHACPGYFIERLRRSSPLCRPLKAGLNQSTLRFPSAEAWLHSNRPLRGRGVVGCRVSCLTAVFVLPYCSSHSHIIRSAAAFRRHPINDLIRVHDVAGLAVDAVGEVDLELAAGLWCCTLPHGRVSAS